MAWNPAGDARADAEDAAMDELVAEAADAARKGWSFYGWWMGCVCRKRERVRFIRHEVWLACRAAHAVDAARESGYDDTTAAAGAARSRSRVVAPALAGPRERGAARLTPVSRR